MRWKNVLRGWKPHDGHTSSNLMANCLQIIVPELSATKEKECEDRAVFNYIYINNNILSFEIIIYLL